MQDRGGLHRHVVGQGPLVFGAQGSLRLSWNVVTGARIVQRSTVGPDGALRFGPEQRSTDKTRTYYYIADTPDPESLLDALR